MSDHNSVESVHSQSYASNDEEVDFDDIFTDSDDDHHDIAPDYDDEKGYNPPASNGYPEPIAPIYHPESHSPKPIKASTPHKKRDNTHKYKWQWHTGSRWQDYALIDSQTIESQYGSAKFTHVTFRNIQYQIDLTNFVQINPESARKRMVRRVPIASKRNNSHSHSHSRGHSAPSSRPRKQIKSRPKSNTAHEKTQKWQWFNGQQFVDYDKKASIAIEKCYHQHDKVYKYKNNINKQGYTLKFSEWKQYNDRSHMCRDIRRVPLAIKVVKHMKWQWLAGKSFADYPKKYSIAIEKAYNDNINGAGPKEYKFTNNKIRYSIKFSTMKQVNGKTKRSRDVRRVTMDVKGVKPKKRPRQRTKEGWPDHKRWKGPKSTKRRKVFGKKIMKLYHITDANSAKLIFKDHKMIRGAGGMFGGGIYFAETITAAKHKAHKHGILITCKVFTGKEHIVMNFNGGQFDFKQLQKMGVDSVNAPKGAGNGEPERVVYNFDQVCVVKQESCP